METCNGEGVEHSAESNMEHSIWHSMENNMDRKTQKT